MPVFSPFSLRSHTALAVFVGSVLLSTSAFGAPPTPAPKAEAPAKAEVKAETKATAETKASDAKATEKGKPTDPKAAPADPKAAPATEAPAAAAATAPTGPTEEQKAQAGAAFVAGRAAFDAGDYATAEAKFKEANGILPSPHAELLIAQSLDKQNKDAATVVAAYDQFLLNPAASRLNPDEVAAADARAAELRKLLPAKYLFTTEPAGSTVLVDGVAQPSLTPVSVELAPGKHKLEVTHEGFEKTVAEIEVVGGTNIEQPINLIPVPAAAPVKAAPVAVEKKERDMLPAYITLGLGAAGVITGTVFGILALDSKSKFDANPSTALADETERNAIIADMAFGIGLTLGITGLVLLTTDEDDAPPATALQRRVLVAPYAGPTGGGAAARVTF